MTNLADCNYVTQLLNQSNSFFKAYKAVGVHSLVVRRYREESNFDYVHSLYAGVCSQLRTGKLLSEVDLEHFFGFEDFNFISDEIYQEFFNNIDDIEVGYFLASLLVSQTLFNIIRQELCKRTKVQTIILR